MRFIKPFTACAFFLLAWCFAKAQNRADYSVCLRLGYVQATVKAIQINRQLTLKPRSDTCVQVSYIPGREASLVIDGEGFAAQNIRLQPDTLRAALIVVLREPVVHLQEVTVRGNQGAVYRNDTLVIRVDSVRTLPHSTATDLLNNMPGASVEPNGQVKVLGKNVDRVTVDGKPLYDGNAKAALEALNADMIKELELSDGNGSEGSNLNIRLKEDRKQGWYGRAEALAGIRSNYSTTLRGSQIQPNHFLTGFITANNVYDQALTTDDQNSLVRNTLSNDLRGSYSVTETALPRSATVPVSRSLQNVLEAPLNVGQVQTVNGGVNYNRSVKNLQLFGYVLGEQSRQQFVRTFTTARYLNPFRQVNQGASSDFLSRTKGTSYLAGKLQLTTKQSLTFVSNFTLRSITNRQDISQTLQLFRDDSLLSNGNLQQFLAPRRQTIETSHQIAWIQRYNRPAEVLSLYFRYSHLTQILKHFYKNQLNTNSILMLNRKTEWNANENYYEGQAVYARPISRKFLLEWKAQWNYRYLPISQESYRLAGNEVYFLPTASLDLFAAREWQQLARTTLYYKGSRISALLSPTFWRWTAKRSLETTALGSRQQTAFWPGLFIEYRPDAVTRLSVQHGQQQTLPEAEQLFPLPDSSNIQLVRFGNLSLIPITRQTIELNAATSFNSNNVKLVARRAIDTNPIITAAQPNSSGFLSRSYQQSTRHTHSFFASLVWYQLNQQKSYGLHALLTAQWAQGLLATQGSVFPLNTLISVAAAGIKWNGPENVLIKLDWRSIFTQQESSGQEASTVRNIRQEPAFRIEKQWSKKIYSAASGSALLNSYSQGSPNSSVFLDFDLGVFMFSRESLKLNFIARNLLNNKNYYSNLFSSNTEQRDNINRLPRFWLIGLSVFPEKWK